jgi:hypothetical protein
MEPGSFVGRHANSDAFRLGEDRVRGYVYLCAGYLLVRRMIVQDFGRNKT